MRVVFDMSWDILVFFCIVYIVYKVYLLMYFCIKVMVFFVFLLYGVKIWYRGYVWCFWLIFSLLNFLVDLVVGKVDCKCSSCILKCFLIK